MIPVTTRLLRYSAISAVAALVVCLGSTPLSADPATSPVGSSNAASERTPSEPPPPSLSPSAVDGASPAPQKPKVSTEDPPKPPPTAEEPRKPLKASEAEPKALDSERKRRQRILDDQFEELTEDAPPAGGAPAPEAREEARPPAERPTLPAVDDSEAARTDDSQPAPSDDSAQEKPERPATSDSESRSTDKGDADAPDGSKPSAQARNEEGAPESKAAPTADKIFKELTEDAPRAKSEDPPAKPEDKAPTPDKPPAETAEGEPEIEEKHRIKFRWDRGLRIEGRDKKFRLKVGGRLFVDVASISGDKAIESNFETGGFIGARVARIDITGTWGTRLYYRLQVDLTGQSSTGSSRNEYIKSLFVGYVGPRWLGRAELGVVKEPFSMGILTSGLNIDFLERGLPTLFAPSFNPGLLFSNEAFDDRLFWAVGVFRFVGSNSNKNRTDVTARVGGVPWSSDEGRSFVHLGASYAALFGNQFGLEIGSRPETSFGDKWVQASGVDAENGHLFGVELAGAWKGFSYQSEIILSMANRSENEDLLFWGGYAQISYFITGEQRRYLKAQGVFGRVAINRAFSWKKRTWGAWELAARYSYMDLDDAEIRGGIMNNFTIGLNWYILPKLRTMANYVHSHVNGLGTGHVFSVRFQVDL